MTTAHEYREAVAAEFPDIAGIDAIVILADIDEDIARARASEAQERGMISGGFDPTLQHKLDMAEMYKNKAEALEAVRNRFSTFASQKAMLDDYEAGMKAVSD